MKKQNQEVILAHYNTLMTINEDQKITINQIRGKLTRAFEKIAELDGTEEELKSAGAEQIASSPSDLGAILAEKK